MIGTKRGKLQKIRESIVVVVEELHTMVVGVDIVGYLLATFVVVVVLSQSFQVVIVGSVHGVYIRNTDNRLYRC